MWNPLLDCWQITKVFLQRVFADVTDMFTSLLWYTISVLKLSDTKRSPWVCIPGQQFPMCGIGHFWGSSISKGEDEAISLPAGNYKHHNYLNALINKQLLGLFVNMGILNIWNRLSIWILIKPYFLIGFYGNLGALIYVLLISLKR